jgi:hypothetical protein
MTSHSKELSVSETTSIEIITPEIAKAYLATSRLNRAKSSGKIKKYAGILTSGKWRFNGDTIRFNKNGQLMDGQHRLEACIASGVSFKTLVVRGLDDDTFSTMDQGMFRGLRHMLDCKGESHTSVLAAALSWMAMYVNQTEHPLNLDFEGAREMLETFPTLRESISRTWSITRRGSCFVRAAMIVALDCIFSQIDAEMASDLLRRFVEGDALSKRDPYTCGWYLLRARILEEQHKVLKTSPSMIFLLAIKSWNLSRERRVVYCLRYRADGDKKEPYPVAI